MNVKELIMKLEAACNSDPTIWNMPVAITPDSYYAVEIKAVLAVTTEQRPDSQVLILSHFSVSELQAMGKISKDLKPEIDDVLLN